jgi:hypothetical protein
MWCKPGRDIQQNRFQLQLGEFVTVLHVHVRRLIPFVAEAEEPVSIDPQNGWRHSIAGYQLREV